MDTSHEPSVVELRPIVLQGHQRHELYFHWKETDELYIFKNSWTQHSLRMRGTFRQIRCTSDDLRLAGKLQVMLANGYKINYNKLN